MAQRKAELILSDIHDVELSVLLDQVQITFHCRDDYMAQVLFEDLRLRIANGETIALTMNQTNARD